MSKNRNILSKPLNIQLRNTTVPGGADVWKTYYAEVEGTEKNNAFSPIEGAKSANINVYRKIDQTEYDDIRSKDPNLVKVIPNTQNNNNLYLANDAIIIDNQIFATAIAPDNVQREIKNIKAPMIDISNEAIKNSNLINNSNIAPNKAGENTVTSTTPISTAISQPDLQYKPAKLQISYPINMDDNQDRMKFEVYQYANRDTISTEVQDFAKTQFTKVGGEGAPPTVFLPIGQIADTNSVNWENDNMNEIQRRLAGEAYKMVAGGLENLATTSFEAAQHIAAALKDGETNGLANLVKLSFAGQAVGLNNLAPRLTGSIINPNLELLFNSPALRAFNFTFELISRDEGEATVVKQIIKFFKQNMAVREVRDSFFLKTPYVFKITYESGSGEDLEHQSIGKIKYCALKNCGVNYTPLGTYMTFDDPAKTMFMYTITLEFGEILPIYSSDYENNHPIGF